MTRIATTTATAVRTFTIDTTHSEIGFQVRHLMTRVRGRFTDFSGTLEFDREQPEASFVTFSVNTASVDTSTAARDEHLRSEDFFFVEAYPTMTFVSSRIVQRSDDEFDVVGTLTIRGIAKEVTLPVRFLGEASDNGETRVGFEGETTLNRKDFGLQWNAALETGGFLVGDEVKVSVAIQAVGQ